ncbi:hypothetical protein [Sphingomonas prati]|uniref:Uncharacterized protein n=1 Tax=Sphingomonas prati TaxID=1843237 RepID=A0A7W9BRJ5_9SPHN|nr:hypothetical protein [Sphingomonas prati]MBB5728619.1 hypothetical protein [Sphingomonas prati]GGE72359.1 hypothetical protein GCM10011404_01080 [Sphingomonas prati]
MRILPLLLTLAPIAATAAPPILPTPSFGAEPRHCPATDVRKASDSQSGKAQKLGELPPANHYLAVDRRIDRCRAPVIVRTNIGKR